MRLRLTLVLALLCLALPASASAYVIGGHAWPGHRITYYNADRRLSKAVGLAVHTWNTSGAHIRFVRASRHRAQVILASGNASRIPLAFPTSVYDSGGCAGFADVGWWPGRRHAHVTLDRHCVGLLISAEVVTHELGHILGLQHPSRGCALMTPTPYMSCRHIPRVWQYRCHFIERDDLRGAVRLYGGRVRARPSFCEVYKKPSPPMDLKVDLFGLGATVSWVNPPLPRSARPEFKQPIVGAALDVSPGNCTSKDPLSGFSGPGIEIAGGREQSVYTERPRHPGPYCFTLRLQDEFGRGGRVSTVVAIPNEPPEVAFTVLPEFADSNCVYVSDSSVDQDGEITARQWDFGAPGDADNTSASAFGDHCYSQPGAYTVTLTVTDDSGGRASGTQTVTVPQ